jgi:hypothetical protein
MNRESRPSPPRRLVADDRLIVGRLESHGAANYQFREGASESYYLKVLTMRGIEVLWGKDLGRALAESRSQPKIGSVIAARRTSFDAFTITEKRRDEAGRMVEAPRQVKRYQWIVESPEFFAERAKLARRVRDAREEAHHAVKSHPELASTYLSLRGAQEIAERRIADPKDRERFVALVREAMGKSIKNGEPLPDMRLRDQSTQRTHDLASPPTAQKRDAPTR